MTQPKKSLAELCAERKQMRERRALPRISKEHAGMLRLICQGGTWRPSVGQRLIRSYYMAERNSQQRNIEFSLSLYDLAKIARRSQGRCEITGIRFEAVPTTRKWDRQPWTASIDRIDCSKGYSFENCRLVCAAVNVALNAWGETVLERIAEAIIEQKLRQHLGYIEKIRDMHRKISRRNRYLKGVA